MRASHGERDLANSSMTPPTPDLHGINPVFLSSNPSCWSVEEVYEFIASLQGEVGSSPAVLSSSSMGKFVGSLYGKKVVSVVPSAFIVLLYIILNWSRSYRQMSYTPQAADCGVEWGWLDS